MTDHRPTILVVDDEAMLRVSLSMSLEASGYRVVEAGNVLQAVAAISSQSFAGIVTDVDMPGNLNGLDLADLVSVCQPSTAVVIVSGSVLPMEYAMPDKAIFLMKPYDEHAVARELGRQIAHRRQVQRHPRVA